MTSRWADVVVGLHAAYIGFVVLAPLFIVVGAWRGWHWVRNVWFRTVHVAMIGIVVVEALLGIECPLTTWEDQLREQAGATVADGSFIGRCLHDLVFVDVAPGTMTAVYVAFGLLVAGLLLVVPIRLRANA